MERRTESSTEPGRQPPATHEFLCSEDTTLFCAQDPKATLQIGAVALFTAAPLRDEQGRLRLEDLRRHVEGRLGGVPRFRRRLVHAPFGQGPPLWVDDEGFDIANHVRVTALPRPGDEKQLRELVSRLLEQPLDARRPLWEVWIVDGVEGDRVAVIPKVSHVMADGIALLDFSLSVLDAEPRDEPAEPDPIVPGSSPGPIELLGAAVEEQAHRRISGMAALVGTLASPSRLAGWAAATARALTAGPVRAPRLAITAPVGSHRDVIWWRASMAELQAVKAAQDVSLNDVVLAIVAGGLRGYLSGERQDVDGLRPRVLVPVSMHGGADESLRNRFSMMVADLPVAVADPIERLRVVHAEMVRHKASNETSSNSLLLRASDLLPTRLLQALAPPVMRHQPFVNLAVTNLPGTTEPLFLLGARLLEMYPLITVTGNIAVIIGVLSYEDGLGIGITVDADVVGDVDELAAAIDRSAHDLIEAVREAGAATTADITSTASTS